MSQMEEEEYANALIHYFQLGLLPLPDGTTLRAHIALRLRYFLVMNPIMNSLVISDEGQMRPDAGDEEIHGEFAPGEKNVQSMR